MLNNLLIGLTFFLICSLSNAKTFSCVVLDVKTVTTDGKMKSSKIAEHLIPIRSKFFVNSLDGKIFGDVITNQRTDAKGTRVLNEGEEGSNNIKIFTELGGGHGNLGNILVLQILICCTEKNTVKVPFIGVFLENTFSGVCEKQN